MNVWCNCLCCSRLSSFPLTLLGLLAAGSQLPFCYSYTLRCYFRSSAHWSGWVSQSWWEWGAAPGSCSTICWYRLSVWWEIFFSLSVDEVMHFLGTHKLRSFWNYLLRPYHVAFCVSWPFKKTSDPYCFSHNTNSVSYLHPMPLSWELTLRFSQDPLGVTLPPEKVLAIFPTLLLTPSALSLSTKLLSLKWMC